MWVMKRPPKNMTSVTRNTHIPTVAVSRCWSAVANCSRTARERNSDNFEFLLHGFVIIGVVSHHRRRFQFVLRRRRRRLPFKPRAAPRIRPRRLSVLPRPDQVDQRQDVTDA